MKKVRCDMCGQDHDLYMTIGTGNVEVQFCHTCVRKVMTVAAAEVLKQSTPTKH